MVDILENAVVRIDIGINYSSLNDKEIELLDKIFAMGDLQFNAPCNNRLARIAELKPEARLLNQNETNKQTEITNKVLELSVAIAHDKEQGNYRDYGTLKRRIAQGAIASEVYSMMPYFYAEAYNLNCRFSSRDSDNDSIVSTSFIEEAPKWITFLKSLSDFIRTFGGSV